MKRKTTKEILVDAFIEVAETKDVDKITIKDIVDNCGYSTATFYRQFKDKYDLIAWSYTQTVVKTMEQIGKDGYEWKETLLEGAKIFESNREVLANLLLHTSGHDAFFNHMTEINYQALKGFVQHTKGEEMLDESTDMLIRLYCMGTVGLTCDWIMGKYKVTPEKLAQAYEKGLPQPLMELLM